MITLQMTAVPWPAGCAIYAEGLASGPARFNTAPPSWSAWDAGHLPGSRLGAVNESVPVAGLSWATLSSVSGHSAYAGGSEPGEWRDTVLPESRSTVMGLAPLAL
jgi:phosphinothricin acetyltransferase